VFHATRWCQNGLREHFRNWLFEHSGMKVLIVEDEFKTAAFLKRGLEENGFVADVTDNGEDGAQLAQTKSYDLIILDVMLPGRDGWSIISDLRKREVGTPVLFLTAREALSDYPRLRCHRVTRGGRWRSGREWCAHRLRRRSRVMASIR
jgi:CheY-like chemotaxis protein